jgi:folate-binding protein YgfZ
MTMQQWDTWVAAKGGRILEHGKVEFTSHEQDLALLAGGNTILSPLCDFALIRARGDDALTFLQGQLSSDLREVDATHSQYSSFSNAKGRLQANLWIWGYQSDYYLMLPADIAPTLHKRLSMFVLRSKVKLELVTQEWKLIGLAGEQAKASLIGIGITPPAPQHAECETAFGFAVALPSGAYLLAAKADCADSVVEPLLQDAKLVGSEAWSLLDIRAGRPWITLPTYEHFVAQMANHELIGAVSFKKGCFPGQEIVARTQYLGKLKKRLFHVRLPQGAKPGDELFSPTMREQAIGMVVNVCRVNNEQAEALAVVQINCWDSGVHYSSLEGPLLERLELPYTLGENEESI